MSGSKALPDLLEGQQWGYSQRSRYRAMAGPVMAHVVVAASGSSAGTYGYLLCSGGWAIVGNSGGDPCRKCVQLLREHSEEKQ